MAQKGLWNVARERILRDRGALPKEGGDLVREYKAMHEGNFLRSWLRRMWNRRKKVMDKEAREVESRSGFGKAEREKGDNGCG